MEKTQNIIKLAPNLSPRERFKLILADCNKSIDTGESVFNEEETTALTQFTEHAAWSEYAYLWGFFLGSHIFLYNLIELAWLRFLRTLDHLICFDVSLIDKGLKSALKEWKVLMPWGPEELISLCEEEIRELLRYEGVANEIEKIFDGSHPFSESYRTEFNERLEGIKGIIKFHNELVDLTKDPKLRKLKITEVELSPEETKEGLEIMKDFVKGLCRLLGASYEYGEKIANN
jgi:hypothetical protein